MLSNSSSCNSFEDYAGQPALVSYLRRIFGSGPVSHAYMFYGPKGAGKRTLAGLSARALFCIGENKPCGVCGPCRRFLTSNHPDVTVLKPQPSSIGVSEVRALVASLAVRSYEGGYKAVIIEQADAMTAQAANALLKTLESPPGATVFFLLTEKTLMPTLVSRCLPIRFGRVSADDVIKALEFHGLPGDVAQRLAPLSDGLVGKALSIYQEGPEMREAVSDVLTRAKTVADIAECSKRLLDFDHDRVLDIIEEELSRSLKPPLAQAGGTEKKIALHTALREARMKLKSHVGFQSVLETVLFALTGG